MMERQDEDRLVELIEWLERTGHEAEFRLVIDRLALGLKSSCSSVAYKCDPQRIINEGLVTTEFVFPLAELAKAAPVDDLVLVEEWLRVISCNGIEARLEDVHLVGKSVVILRHDYVPQNIRDEFIDQYAAASTKLVNAIRSWQEKQ